MTEFMVQALFDGAFSADIHRDPRSVEYQQGVIAALRYRINQAAIIRPYTAGTARADAWFAGVDEGHRLWREYDADRRRFGADNGTGDHLVCGGGKPAAHPGQ
jgi:hypothetical protein